MPRVSRLLHTLLILFLVMLISYFITYNTACRAVPIIPAFPFQLGIVATEEEHLPNCMQLRQEDPYPTSGEPLSGKNLCETFTGTKRTDCVYLHPEIFHYIYFKNNPKDSVLGFQEYLSIYSVDKFYKPEKIVIHCNQPITGKYWEMV